MNKIEEHWQKVIDEKKALKAVAAAEYISMSRSFLRRARMEGQVGNRTPGPNFIRRGRSILYLVSDLDAWLEEGRQVQGQ